LREMYGEVVVDFPTASRQRMTQRAQNGGPYISGTTLRGTNGAGHRDGPPNPHRASTVIRLLRASEVAFWGTNNPAVEESSREPWTSDGPSSARRGPGAGVELPSAGSSASPAMPGSSGRYASIPSLPSRNLGYGRKRRARDSLVRWRGRRCGRPQ
jgi:hypothetical protein